MGSLLSPAVALLSIMLPSCPVLGRPPLGDVVRLWMLDLDDGVLGEVLEEISRPRTGPHSAWTRCSTSTASWYRSRLCVSRRYGKSGWIGAGGVNATKGGNASRQVLEVCSFLNVYTYIYIFKVPVEIVGSHDIAVLVQPCDQPHQRNI